MTDTTEPCWLIITSDRRFAKQFGLDPQQAVVKLPPGTTVRKLGPKGSQLSLVELAHRYVQGIDFELTIRRKPNAVSYAPGGFEELN